MLFRLLSENNRSFLSKIFRLVCENCSHRDLKRVVENYIFLKNTISVSFCMVSLGDWTKTFGVSTKKSAGLTKLHSLILFSPYERFLRKNEIFQKKSVFISSGHGARKNGLYSFFLPLLCQNFILTVHTTIFTVFFENLTIFLLTFWHLTFWQKVEKFF